MRKSKYLILPLIALTCVGGMSVVAKERKNTQTKKVENLSAPGDTLNKKEKKIVPEPVKNDPVQLTEEVELTEEVKQVFDMTNPVKESSENLTAKVKAGTDMTPYYNKGDSIINNYLLLPLEEKYTSEGKINRMIKYVDNTPQEWRSPDFKETYKNYMPLLKNYGEYSYQLGMIVERLMDIVKGIAGDNDLKIDPQKGDPAKYYLNVFLKGELKVSPLNNNILPFDYLPIYKKSESNPSIYYLDDRIEEIKKAMIGYSNYLKKTGKSADRTDAATTLRLLKDIRNMLPGKFTDKIQDVESPKQYNAASMIPDAKIQSRPISPAAVEVSKNKKNTSSSKAESGKQKGKTQPASKAKSGNVNKEDVSKAKKQTAPESQSQKPNKKVAKDKGKGNNKKVVTLQEIDEQIDMLNDKIDEMKSERAEKQEELDKYNKRKDLYEYDIKELEDEIKEMGVKINDLRKKVKEFEAARAKLPGGPNPMKK